MPPRKPWAKPEIRKVRVSEEFDPADGLTRAQWEAARRLLQRTECHATDDR